MSFLLSRFSPTNKKIIHYFEIERLSTRFLSPNGHFQLYYDFNNTLYLPHLQTHVKRPILQQEQKMKLTPQQTNYENKNPFINQFNSSYRSIG